MGVSDGGKCDIILLKFMEIRGQHMDGELVINIPSESEWSRRAVKF